MIQRLTSSIRRLGRYLETVEAHRVDAYLSSAVDVYDLERRMRELDKRRMSLDFTNVYLGMSSGTGH